MDSMGKPTVSAEKGERKEESCSHGGPPDSRRSRGFVRGGDDRDPPDGRGEESKNLMHDTTQDKSRKREAPPLEVESISGEEDLEEESESAESSVDWSDVSVDGAEDGDLREDEMESWPKALSEKYTVSCVIGEGDFGGFFFDQSANDSATFSDSSSNSSALGMLPTSESEGGASLFRGLS